MRFRPSRATQQQDDYVYACFYVWDDYVLSKYAKGTYMSNCYVWEWIIMIFISIFIMFISLLEACGYLGIETIFMFKHTELANRD